MESNQSSLFNCTIIEEGMLSKLPDYKFVLSDIGEGSMEELKNSMEVAQE
jgi:hypothetical protein